LFLFDFPSNLAGSVAEDRPAAWEPAVRELEQLEGRVQHAVLQRVATTVETALSDMGARTLENIKIKK